MTQVIKSKKFRIKWRDVARGLITAVLTSVLMAIQQMADAGELNWKMVGMAAIGGGVGYILKNWLLEPPKVIVTTKTNEQLNEVEDILK